MNYPTIYPTRKQHRRRKNEKKRISQQRSNLYRQRGNPVRRPLIKGFPVPWKNRVACKASERAQKFAYAAHRIDDIITVIDVTSAKVETPVFLEDRFTSFFSFHPSSVEPFFSLSFSLSTFLCLLFPCTSFSWPCSNGRTLHRRWTSEEGSCVSSLKSGVARPTSNDNVDVDQGNGNAWLGRHAVHDSRLRAHPCVNRD